MDPMEFRDSERIRGENTGCARDKEGVEDKKDAMDPMDSERSREPN